MPGHQVPGNPDLMRFLLTALLVIHGAIHLLGFLKAHELAELPELQLAVGAGMGLLWLAAAILLFLAAAGLIVTPRVWWVPALLGVVLSQLLITGAWADAWAGTIVNALLLVPIALAAADVRPSSLQSIYRREVRSALESTSREDTPITSADLAGLPPRIRRYLERVGVVGEPRVWSFHAGFRARIRGAPEDRWMAGTAEQYELFHPPARLFFMKARKLGLPVHVLHRYVGDSATMEGRLLGLLTIFEISGPELTRSETVTLLNDILFMAPAALVDLPVEWEVLDAYRVRATFTHAGHTVTAIAYFDEEGDLVDFDSEDRYQMDRDPPTLARWSTPFYEPRELGGRRLPSGGETRWGDPGEEWTYGDFTLRWIRYNVVTGP